MLGLRAFWGDGRDSAGDCAGMDARSRPRPGLRRAAVAEPGSGDFKNQEIPNSRPAREWCPGRRPRGVFRDSAVSCGILVDR